MMLECPRCKKKLATIVWRYVQPVDDFAVWDEEGQCYEYDDSTDKGSLDCVTLCPECGLKLKDFGYDGHQEHRVLQEGEHLKVYVAKFRIIEGEHEYGQAFLVQAESYDEAFELAKSQEHEPEIPDDDTDELACWDYGDGMTASRLESVVEITEEEATLIRRLGLAYNFN